MAYTYCAMLMAKCTCILIASSVKLLPGTLLLCTDSSKPGWFHVETYMHVLGLWFANETATKMTIKRVGW